MTTNKRHTVYNHDIYDAQDADVVDDDYCDNIDSDIHLIEANMNKQINKNAPRLSFNQWQSLSSNARTIWSTMPDKNIAVIIRGQQGSTNSPSSSTMNRGNPHVLLMYMRLSTLMMLIIMVLMMLTLLITYLMNQTLLL
jgi:hypothetical protein